MQVVADFLEWYLVELLDDVLDTRLDHLELTRDGRQLHWRLRPVYRRRGRAREKVERHEHGPGQQVPSPRLRTDPVGNHGVDQLPAHPLEIRAGRPVDNPDPE